MDKSAVAFDDENNTKVGTTYTKVKPDIGTAKPSDLRAKFERMVILNINPKLANQFRLFQTSSDSNASSTASSPAPKKNIHAKAAMFNNKNDETPSTPPPDRITKQLDASKTAFLSQPCEVKPTPVEKTPGQLNMSKLTQFTENPTNHTTLNQSSAVNYFIKHIYNTNSIIVIITDQRRT